MVMKSSVGVVVKVGMLLVSGVKNSVRRNRMVMMMVVRLVWLLVLMFVVDLM